MAKKAPEPAPDVFIDNAFAKECLWRLTQYERNGIPGGVATELAWRSDVDWHLVVAAANNGASETQLREIFL
jgi:hypothetical protein